MTIENTSIVDAIGTDKVTGAVHLTITDHLPWDVDNHLQMLREKINVYLDFIESGEIYVAYPGAKGRSLVIDVVTKFPLTEEVHLFFGRAEAVALENGVALRQHVYSGGSPDDSLSQI